MFVCNFCFFFVVNIVDKNNVVPTKRSVFLNFVCFFVFYIHKSYNILLYEEFEKKIRYVLQLYLYINKGFKF